MIAVHVVQVDVQQSFYLRFLNGFNVRVERATKEISFSHFHFSLFSPDPDKSKKSGRDRGYNTVCKVNATLCFYSFLCLLLYLLHATLSTRTRKTFNTTKTQNNTSYKNKNTNARRRKLQESKCSVGRQKINHTRRRFRRIARMNPIPVRYKGRSPGF